MSGARMLNLSMMLVSVVALSACTSARPRGVTSLGSAAPSNGLSCAIRHAESLGYTTVNLVDASTAVLARPRGTPIGKEVLTRVLSLGTAGADKGLEDRFIVSNPEQFLRIDVVGVEGTGNDAPPTDAGRRDADAVMAACS